MQLIDPFARRIAYLRLSVTDFCNYRCVYCLPDGFQGCRNPDELSLPEIRTLVDAFAQLGTQKIRLSGGEPTLRKDIIEIVEACAAQAGIEKVAITTNGHRLAHLYRDLLDAGIGQINVSVDSFRADTFRKLTGRSSLANILQAIDKMLENDFNAIKLNALLMRESMPEMLEDTLAYIKHRPVTMRFIELMRTGENHRLYEKSHLSAANLSAQLLREGWQMQTRSPLAGPAIEFHHDDFMGKIGIIAPYSETFCQSCNRLRISSVGKLYLCLFASIHYDLRQILRNEDSAALIARLKQLIVLKPERHFLHARDTGLTSNLAQIGG